MGSKGVLQGYNAQAAATENQIVVAAEVHATTNGRRHAGAHGHGGGCRPRCGRARRRRGGISVADAGYWTAADAETEVVARGS